MPVKVNELLAMVQADAGDWFAKKAVTASSIICSNLAQ